MIPVYSKVKFYKGKTSIISIIQIENIITPQKYWKACLTNFVTIVFTTYVVGLPRWCINVNEEAKMPDFTVLKKWILRLMQSK